MDDSTMNHGSKPETLCRVCGDKASGKHYGVASCDGCRGFFKRSIRRNLEYVCKENGRCVVDVTRRNQCQACRFRKCLQVNMKRDAVQHERAPRTSHQPLTQPYPVAAGLLGPRGLRTVPGTASLFATGLPLSLPLPHESHNPYLQPQSTGFLYPSMLASFVKPTLFTATGLMNNSSAFSQKFDSISGLTAQRTITITAGKDDEVTSSEEAGLTERNSTEEVRTNSSNSLRNHFKPIDMSTLTVLPTENVYESAAKLLFLSVKWARTIPSFLQLSYKDQSILLEESWSELFILTASQWSLPIDESVLVANTTASSSRSLALEEDARKLRDVITRLTLLRVDHTEYACLKALVLFKAECRGICDPIHIELLQDQTHVMLHEYCASRPCTPKGRFGKLLLLLPAIQAVSRRSLEELLFRKTVGDVAIDRLLGDMMKATHNN